MQLLMRRPAETKLKVYQMLLSMVNGKWSIENHGFDDRLYKTGMPAFQPAFTLNETANI
jgi:hypothetical protein